VAALSLTDVEQAIRSSWGRDTYPPDERTPWDPDNPARGQCGVTAVVLNDIFGGELVRGEVHVDGERVDFHWWNRLPGGLEIDLTREQLGPHEIVTDGVAIARPPNTEIKRLKAEYELLRQRVFDALAAQQGRGQTVPCIAVGGVPT
jgi:hypothetical protein